jgi:hypothetical protein
LLCSCDERAAEFISVVVCFAMAVLVCVCTQSCEATNPQRMLRRHQCDGRAGPGFNAAEHITITSAVDPCCQPWPAMLHQADRW